MTEDFRGREIESGPCRWFRRRWEYGSVLVLNVDHFVAAYDLSRGMLVEWKHADARERNFRVIPEIARKLGWWAALFIYETDDGTLDGSVTAINYEAVDPNGKRYASLLDEAAFDAWVCDQFGARPRPGANLW